MSTTENNPPVENAPAAPPDNQRRPAPERAPKPPPARRGRVSSGLALIFAFVALLGTGYLWYTLIYQRPELTQMDLPSALADIERTAAELEVSQDDVKDQIGALTETQNTLKAALDNLQAELGRNQAQWIINETEQLLLIANRRLQLAREVSSALAALRAADRQLELLASPNLLPVRREISKEIAQLESVERTDVAGISLRLGQLADRVDQLALAPDLRAMREQVASAPPGDEDGASTNSIWQDLIELVRIRRHDAARRPLLPPEQQYFARENLRLMLYGAQHALLQGNVRTFQQNLSTARQWIADYYDPGAGAVAAVLEEVEKLRETPVMNELPDISGSLEMLRKSRQRGA